MQLLNPIYTKFLILSVNPSDGQFQRDVKKMIFFPGLNVRLARQMPQPIRRFYLDNGIFQ